LARIAVALLLAVQVPGGPGEGVLPHHRGALLDRGRELVDEADELADRGEPVPPELRAFTSSVASQLTPTVPLSTGAPPATRGGAAWHGQGLAAVCHRRGGGIARGRRHGAEPGRVQPRTHGAMTTRLSASRPSGPSANTARGMVAPPQRFQLVVRDAPSRATR